MRDSIYRITLDMHDVASQIQIAVKQYDTARSLHITLMENGKPFQISEGCRAILSIARNESTVVVDDCEIRLKDSVIIYEFNNKTARSLGINECELKLYDLDGDLLTSPKFTILVNDNVFNDGDEHGVDHNLILNRDKSDQHPIRSITGLEDNLLLIKNNHTSLEKKVNEIPNNDSIGKEKFKPELRDYLDGCNNMISDQWDQSVSYDVNSYCIYDNALWKCKSQNSAQIPAEGDYWTKCSVSSETSELNSKLFPNYKTVNDALLDTCYSGVYVYKGNTLNAPSTNAGTILVISDEDSLYANRMAIDSAGYMYTSTYAPGESYGQWSMIPKIIVEQGELLGQGLSYVSLIGKPGYTLVSAVNVSQQTCDAGVTYFSWNNQSQVYLLFFNRNLNSGEQFALKTVWLQQ